MVRVFLPSGEHRDYDDADDFTLTKDGLVVSGHGPDGIAKVHLAAYGPGRFDHAERLPAGTPPPERTGPLIA